MAAVSDNTESVSQGITVQVDGNTPYLFRTDGVTILYENLKTEYVKVYDKLPSRRDSAPGHRGSGARLIDGEVKISTEVNSESSLDCAFVAKVAVRRERTACEEVRQMKEVNKRCIIGEVSIGYQGTMESDRRWILSLDLDSVYNAQEDGVLKDVYALCPTNIEITNKFQLITELFARSIDEAGNEVDQLLAKKESKPFLVRLGLGRATRFVNKNSN